MIDKLSHLHKTLLASLTPYQSLEQSLWLRTHWSSHIEEPSPMSFWHNDELISNKMVRIGFIPLLLVKEHVLPLDTNGFKNDVEGVKSQSI
jgi:hypothetical protein